MAAGRRELPALKMDLGELSVGFLGGLGRKVGHVGQAAEKCQGVARASDLLEVPCASENVVGEVERPAHGAASLQQVMKTTGSAGADYKRSGAAGKTICTGYENFEGPWPGSVREGQGPCSMPG
jgi:hypothetical protein